MRNHIDISDIRKRKSVLAESSEMSRTISIDNAYEQAKKTDRFDDIRHFMQECAKTRYNATQYIRPCIEFIESTTSPELISIFKNDILPRVNDYEVGYLNEFATSSDLKEIIKEQVVKNKIADRVISNHENISNKFNVCSLFENFNDSNNLDNRIKAVCRVIDEFDLPMYAKVNIAIEENSYLLQMYDIPYEEFSLARSILEYYSISGQMNDQDIQNINTVFKQNYMLENVDITPSKVDSKIIEVVDKYIARSEHNPFELKVVNDAVFSAPIDDWFRNIDKYFCILTNIVIHGSDSDKNVVINTILPTFATRFEETFIGSPKYKDLAAHVADVINNDIIPKKLDDNEFLRKKYKFDMSENMESSSLYKVALISLANQLVDIRDIAYTAENVIYMTQTPLSESTSAVTLYEYKDHKYDPLIYKLYKFDKYVQKEIRGWAQKTGQKITNTIKDKAEDLEKKIYEEVSIYDMIVENNIDYVVDSYEFNENSVKMNDIHKMCTSIVKVFNESELKDTSFVAYYTLEFGIINFHLKDNTELLLSEDERCLANENLTESDINKLIYPLFTAECLDEDFDLFDDATRFFIENSTGEAFGIFCDACSLAGVKKNTVEDIYEYVKMRSGLEFALENAYKVNTYKEEYNLNPYIVTQSLMAIQALFEATTPLESKNKKVASKIDPKTRVKATTTAKSPTTKTTKTTPTTKNVKNTVTSKVADVKEKVKSGENPLKGLNLNNLKLYVAGLKKNMKDLDSKTQTHVRNMDYMVEKLIKDLKGALVSDRRESIIKGSVIPSFHKCILIAVGLAGLAWFNAPLAVITAIGGFATSKKLTERERALMLDDIEIELELLDKEIGMADSRNQIKKMRQLMKMKTQLQREYQRIKYNIRLGKDIIPSSTYIPKKE